MAELPTLAEKVKAFRDNHNKGMAEHSAKVTKASVNKRYFQYQSIQEAYVIAHELYQPENKAELDALLEKHKIKRDKRKGSNPWMPIVNLLFGSWNGETFMPDDSAKKYAPSFRYFHERGWVPEHVADELMDKTGRPTSFGVFGKGLVGTEKAGRYEHRGEEEDERVAEARLQAMMKAAQPITSFPRNELTLHAMESGQFLQLWGYLSTDGRQVHVMGMVEKGSVPARRYAERSMREIWEFVRKHVHLGQAIGMGKYKTRIPQLTYENVWKPVVDMATADKAAKAAAVEKPSANAPAKPAKRQTARKGVDVAGLKGKLSSKRKEASNAVAA